MHSGNKIATPTHSWICGYWY